MFRHSSARLLVLTGCVLSCGLLARAGLSQERGAQRLFIESVKLPQTTPGAFINRYGLTRDDLQNIRKHVAGIKWVIPMRNTAIEARYGSETIDVWLYGTDENYSHKLNPQKLHGRFLLDKDVTHLNNVAVIGDGVAKALFGNRDPIGRNVRIGRDYYLIVGRFESPILQQKFPGEPAIDHSRSIFIPLSTMKARMGDDQIIREEGAFSAESFELSYLEIVPEKPNQTLQTWNSIQRLLKMNHPKPDYRVQILR